MKSEPFELLRLDAALALARWRRALRRHGPAGPAASGVADAAALLLLLGAAASFALVGALLFGHLAVSGDRELALGVAGWLGDAAVVLTALAAVLGDPRRGGADARPLALLPIARSSRLAADLTGWLLLRPTALVIWPAALAPLAGMARAGEAAALALVPASAALALVAASGASLARRGVAALRGLPLPLALPARALLLLAPPAWLFVRLTPEGLALARSPLLPLPGSFMAGAAARALAGGSALPAATGLAAVAALLTLLSAALPDEPLSRAAAARRPAPAFRAELRRLLGAARARELLVHGTGGAALVLVAGLIVADQGEAGGALAHAAVLLAAWIAATATAPLAANLLGWGGAAGASCALVPAPAWRLLAPPLFAVSFTPLLAVLATGVGAALLFAPRTGLQAAAAGAAAICAGAGAGAFASCAWPRAACLDRSGDPLWGRDPARLLLPAAQALAFAPAALAGGGRAALASIATGILIGTAGFHLGARRLDRRRTEIAEELLT